MKKIKFLLISFISIFVFSINVFAASGSLSVSSGSVYVGDNFTVTANVISAAAWNIHVSAIGPVSGCQINQADATADAMDTNKSFSATCTATGTGTITLILSGDVTSASNGNAVNISGSRSIVVTQRPTPSGGNNNTSSNNNISSNNNASNNNTDNKSKNTNIKELSVEGYELSKIDENNYILSVPNDVTSINIKAIASDSKSKITGTGNHNLNIGENNIEVIITAEDGSQNKINIKVTRKDGYYLEDLDSVLKNNKSDDINITIKSDTKITAQDLEKIKSSRKTVKFNYYNDDKTLLYSWIIDGSKLKNNNNDLITTITNDSENNKNILRLSNYADGLFIILKQTNNLPLGAKLKLFVGNKYKDNDLINVYAYVKNNDKLRLVKNKFKVKNGYIEFEVVDESDYFVTMSTIPNLDKIITTTDKSLSPVLLIIIVILSLSVIGLIVAFIIKNKKNKEDYNNNNNNFKSNIAISNYKALDTDTNEINTINSSNKTYNNKINQQNSTTTTTNENYNNYSDYNSQSNNNSDLL